ncbi:MAG TPA: DUF2911 domain-containing protein [Saprospiraceae bacterium]|nr:DUF2911 domain-containing protein [Saprospiraceae bacterium]
MKKLLAVLLPTMLFCAVLQAQITTPMPSPTAEFKQKVGLTDISLNYSRPGVKGRKIFATDGLVPFGKIWRTGANAATTIEFSEDVMFGDKDVPKGKYALYTIPGETSWSVMLYSDTELGGDVDNYDAAKEVARVSATPQLLGFSLETFTMDVGNITDNSASLVLAWEMTYVPVGIKVFTEKQVSTQIENFAKNPLSQVASNYLNAGWYYYNKGENLAVAADYMKKGVEYSTSPFKFFWMNRAAEVLAKTGDIKGALEMAKAAHENGMNAPTGDAKAFYENTVKAQLDENIRKWNM